MWRLSKMRYAQFLEQTIFDKQQVLALSQGNLVTDPPDEFVRLAIR